MNLSRQGFSTFVIGSANCFGGLFFRASDEEEDKFEDDEDEELDDNFLETFYLLFGISYSVIYFLFNPQFLL